LRGIGRLGPSVTGDIESYRRPERRVRPGCEPRGACGRPARDRSTVTGLRSTPGHGGKHPGPASKSRIAAAGRPSGLRTRVHVTFSLSLAAPAYRARAVPAT
jgi:hypothetical protein